MEALRTDSEAGVRESAAWALGSFEEPEAIPALVEALRGDDVVEVRRQATWALGQIEHEDAVPGLGEALDDPDEKVRETAIWALGQIESPSLQDHLRLTVSPGLYFHVLPGNPLAPAGAEHLEDRFLGGETTGHILLGYGFLVDRADLADRENPHEKPIPVSLDEIPDPVHLHDVDARPQYHRTFPRVSLSIPLEEGCMWRIPYHTE